MPLFWIAISFVCGLLVGKYIPLPAWAWVAVCTLLLVSIIIGRNNFKQSLLFRIEPQVLHLWPVVLVLCFTLGGLRYALSRPHWNESNLAWYNGSGSYLLTAVVSSSPDERENATYLRVTARELYDPVTLTYRRIDGEALLSLPANNPWQLGDMLLFTGSPITPSDKEDFSYRDYLERFGVYTIFYHPSSVTLVGSRQVGNVTQALEWVRQRATRTIFTLFPQPESGLLIGILLGNDNNLPANVKLAFRDTGTAHIIAISGFNMSVMAAICAGIFSRFFNRRLTMLLSSLVLVVYTLLVGASPSVLRALLMAIFAFGGQLIGRSHAGLNGLGLAAGVMTTLNPFLPWDASFQLSFAATLGLLLFATPMKEWLSERLERRFSESTARRLTGPVCEYFLYSMAAQVMTLPVIALQFRRVSLSSLIANPLVLPVQPAILICGMAVTLMGMVWPEGGRALAALVWPLLAWTNGVAQRIAAWKWGSITLSETASIWLAVLVAVLILTFVLRGFLVKKIKHVNWFYVGLVVLVAVGFLTAMFSRRPDGNLHLSILRAGDGTALFLRSPSGSTLMIDPSGSVNQLASAISRQVPPWNVHVDGVLLTSRDHAQDIDTLNEQLPMRQAILTLPVHRLDDTLSPVVLPAGMEVKQLAEGEVIQMEEGLTVNPIAADSEHTALLIEYGNTRILIPGGVDPALLVAQQADNLSSLALLILNEEDVANLPPDMWTNFSARHILWNSPAVLPLPDWIGLQGADWIMISTNGLEYNFDSPSISY